jgi:hypothetical protein
MSEHQRPFYIARNEHRYFTKVREYIDEMLEEQGRSLCQEIEDLGRKNDKLKDSHDEGHVRARKEEIESLKKEIKGLKQGHETLVGDRMVIDTDEYESLKKEIESLKKAANEGEGLLSAEGYWWDEKRETWRWKEDGVSDEEEEE